MKYKVNDRVIGHRIGNHGKIDTLGTVIYEKNDGHFLVEFDEDIKGHDGSHASPVCGKDGFCWFCRDHELTLVKPVKKKMITKVEVEGKL